MPKSEKEFHKETTMITPGIDLKKEKDKKDGIGKDKVKTTAFKDA